MRCFLNFDTIHGTYCCFDLRRKKNRTFEIPTLFACFWHVDFTLFLNLYDRLPISWISRENAGGYELKCSEYNSTHCATERNDNFACLFRIMDVLKNSSFIIYNYSSSFQLFLSDIQFLMLYYHAQTQENRNFFMHNMSKNNKNKNFSISFCIFTDSLLYATLLDCHTLS